jgi:hypothetical protein
MKTCSHGVFSLFLPLEEGRGEGAVTWTSFNPLLQTAVQGLARRKNRFPVGGVRVMLFVPLAVVIV